MEEGQKGYQGLTLTNFANETTEPAITQGSIVEVAGSLYEFTAQEAISGFGGVANGTQAYIEITAAGATATAAWSTTAPTWDTDKQGYYNGALVRSVGGTFKDGGGNATLKFLYTEPNLLTFRKYGTGRMELIDVVNTPNFEAGVTIVAGNLTLTAGDIAFSDADPDITSTKPVDIQKGHFHDSFHDNGSPTEDQLFDFFAPAIPDVTDEVACSGCVETANADEMFIAARAERFSTTAIRLYGVRFRTDLTATGRATFLQFVNGDASTHRAASLAY